MKKIILLLTIFMLAIQSSFSVNPTIGERTNTVDTVSKVCSADTTSVKLTKIVAEPQKVTDTKETKGGGEGAGRIVGFFVLAALCLAIFIGVAY